MHPRHRRQVPDVVHLPPLRKVGVGEVLSESVVVQIVEMRAEPSAVVRHSRVHHRLVQVEAIERQVAECLVVDDVGLRRSEEHTSELQSLMRISYAVFCLKKKKKCT